MCAVWKCVRALLCLVFIIAVHLGNEVIFLPVVTADITGHSEFPQCHTDHLKSLQAGDCIDSRNKSLKYHRRWSANPSPLALQASALATRPPWIVFPNELIKQAKLQTALLVYTPGSSIQLKYNRYNTINHENTPSSSCLSQSVKQLN